MTQKTHPVRNGVLVALISAFLMWLASFVPGLAGPLSTYVWQPASAGIVALWSLITSSVPTPVWLLALLSISSLLGISRLVLRLRGTAELDWREYTTDHFQGVRWRWRYGATRDAIFSIAPYCPADDTLMVGERGYETFQLHCETCGQRRGPFDGDGEDLRDSVERQIDRKLRTGEWKAVLSGELS